jgi:hypothetical protein
VTKSANTLEPTVGMEVTGLSRNARQSNMRNYSCA